MESVYLLDEYKALGTVWYIEVFESLSENKREKLTAEIIEKVTLFENTFSRFKKESLLSVLNVDRHVSYHKELDEMLTIAKGASIKSEGLFSVFIKDSLVEKGYGENDSESKAPVFLDRSRSVENAVSKMYSPPTQKSKVDINAESDFLITKGEILLTGTKSIDLGGIGKGYLIDRLAEYLHNQGVSQFLINGGGDMYVTHKHEEGVKLYLQHPVNRDEVIGEVLLKNQSLCCSSSYVRMWEKGNKKQNHFITKDGSDVWAASYVVGDTATTADIAATVLCLSSHDEQLTKKAAYNFDVTYLVFDEAFNAQGNLDYISVQPLQS